MFVWRFQLTAEFDRKHLKRAGGRIGRNVENVAMKMTTNDKKNHHDSSQKFWQIILTALSRFLDIISLKFESMSFTPMDSTTKGWILNTLNVPCSERVDIYPRKNGMSWTWHWTESTGEAQVLGMWGVWIISSLPLLPGSLWHGLEVSVMVPSMSQMNLFNNYWCWIGILYTSKLFMTVNYSY